MALPPAVLPRVGALLRLLGSDVDGETLGAARALRRTLAAHGADLHALAEAVEHPAERAVLVKREAPRKRREARAGDVVLDHDRRRAVTEALRRALAGERLSEWETTFATSILKRIGDGFGRLTGKQSDALGRLLHRLGEAGTWG